MDASMRIVYFAGRLAYGAELELPNILLNRVINPPVETIETCLVSTLCLVTTASVSVRPPHQPWCIRS